MSAKRALIAKNWIVPESQIALVVVYVYNVVVDHNVSVAQDLAAMIVVSFFALERPCAATVAPACYLRARVSPNVSAITASQVLPANRAPPIMLAPLAPFARLVRLAGPQLAVVSTVLMAIQQCPMGPCVNVTTMMSMDIGRELLVTNVKKVGLIPLALFVMVTMVLKVAPSVVLRDKA